MSTLKIDKMEISSGALREGLLYDMLGRLQHEDARERSIQAMQRRYHVDTEQAQRVEATAALLLEQVKRSWKLDDEHYRQLLVWAARLHEVGLDIAHARYHNHGGYLLANADMPGFVRLEQKLLAALVTFHRRKLDDPFLDDVPNAWRAPLFKLIVLLRLAVLLNRSRSPVELPPIALATRGDALEVRFPEGWLDCNPLTDRGSRAGSGLAGRARVRAARDRRARDLRHFGELAQQRALRGVRLLIRGRARTARSGHPRAAPTPARCRRDTRRGPL